MPWQDQRAQGSDHPKKEATAEEHVDGFQRGKEPISRSQRCRIWRRRLLSP
jgi:hypothetical protein